LAVVLQRIIDSHIHLSEDKNDALTGYANTNGLIYTFDELTQLMDGNNVDCGLLLSPPLKNGTLFPNEKVIQLSNRSKDRLFPVLTATPSLRAVRACINLAKKNRGHVKAFKILLGYFPVYPDDIRFSRLYDYAESEDLPVLFHTGDTATSDGSLIHSHPLTLDTLANKRSSLKIVLCHFGNPWFHDAAELVYKHENVFADLSGLFVGGARYSKRYLGYLSRALSDSIYFIGNSNKLLFGTDYPVSTYPEAIKLIRSLDIEGEDVDKILARNAKQLFHL
jgi:uncharacterized protein